MARPKPNFNWIGSTLGGRYVIKEFIDQGGMSAVYKADDPNLQRTVAIKIIHHHLSLDPKFVRRFEQEAASVAKLRHPNIVQVYDFNHDENTYYMVMEYVPGQTLKQKLKELSAKNQRLPLADTVRMMGSICEAVAFAHEHGMIHRDLKPANVMLTPKGQVVLMDFGVVKMLGEQDLTATGATIGTAKYMSPEQARGERSDERSDIYSLGVILYEMVAGQPPFDADTTVAILMKHVGEPVPDIRQAQKDVPAELAEIIEKALAKHPDDRYQSAAHLGVALGLFSRLGQASAPVTNSQSTVSSPKKRQSAELTAPEPGATVLARPSTPARPVPAIVKPPPASSGFNQLKPWLIGLAVFSLVLLTGIAGLLIYLSGLLSNDAQATGIRAELPSSEGMVRVEGGSYSVGLDAPDKDHAPLQAVELSEYWLDQHEVTNAQYAEFLAATNQPAPPGWSEGKFPAAEENFPVMGVTWDQARAFCEWQNKRLPTEAEWEVAARGATGRLYPWGDNQQAVQLPRSGLYQVGAKLTNQSPFGVLDMAGNVWEWVDQPYAPIPQGQRILRGGANDFLKDMAYRLAGDPSIPTMSASAGIRCAASEVNVVTHDHPIAEGVYFEDSFINPGSGWPILSEGAFYYGYHPPDYYHVEVATAHNIAAVSRPPNFDTVTVEADVLVDHTTTADGLFRYGLLLRRVAEDQYYAFTVSPRTASWIILKSSPAGLEVIQEGPLGELRGVAPAGVTPDQADTLRIDANGPDFVFHINNEIVAQVSDADYANGETGFYVETQDESLAHVHFDRLTIRRIEGGPDETAGALFDDAFTDPNSGWPARDNEGEPYRFGYHPPDYYHVEPRAAHEHIAVALDETYGDIAVETEVFVDHTDSESGDFRYGLVLRRAAEDQFYAFTISPRQGRWQVLKQSPQGLETLAEGDVTSLRGLAPAGVTPDQNDKLRVDALGAAFAFKVNGEAVARVTDADYAEGEVGFYVENLDETLSHIHYESLTIAPVDSAAVTGDGMSDE